VTSPGSRETAAQAFSIFAFTCCKFSANIYKPP
jgi:hypothetical protein